MEPSLKARVRWAFFCLVVIPFVAGTALHFLSLWIGLPLSMLLALYWFGCLCVMMEHNRGEFK